MWYGSRRDFLHTTTRASAGVAAGLLAGTSAMGQQHAGAQREANPLPAGVEVLNPRGRVPLSFIIDDSTCLVNMGHFCTPQFLECYPDRAEYQKDWRSWPREIPDAFVREFGEWCSEHGVKGKYSIVPNPACVGWLDRELPGWSRRDLLASLKLVRELMLPNWDIHPEMITHTRVIDLKTGRPFDEISPSTMENSYPQEKKSVDELAAYLAYALRILKNCDLPCEGVTTPGGFGSRVKSELSLAVQHAVRDVYQTEIPHYFKYVNREAGQGTQPSLEHVSGVGTDDVRVTVNIPAGTGDWFGGWQGDLAPDGPRYCNSDATNGRLVELIKDQEPGVFLCHWPGMYSNGTKEGFRQFQGVVTAINSRYRDQTMWMKLTEIARYWAAKGLTSIKRSERSLSLAAPFAAPGFTLRIANVPQAVPQLKTAQATLPLKRVTNARDLQPGTWIEDKADVVICFDLPKGNCSVLL